MKRKHLLLKEKLAAALHEAFGLRALYDSRASADEVLALFHWDHGIFHAHDGSDAWWNLQPMLIADHREKTRRDIATIAKGKRIQRKQERHKAAMAMKGNHEA